MNIKQLRYIVAIANTGTFREASEQLYVSQPSMSIAVKDLEVELGFKIFDRLNTGVSLTIAGERFYKTRLMEQHTESTVGICQIDHSTVLRGKRLLWGQRRAIYKGTVGRSQIRNGYIAVVTGNLTMHTTDQAVRLVQNNVTFGRCPAQNNVVTGIAGKCHAGHRSGAKA